MMVSGLVLMLMLKSILSGCLKQTTLQTILPVNGANELLKLCSYCALNERLIREIGQ